MNERHSLLTKIKSSYIIKNILTLAFKNMKSVLKFVAYNKVLLDRLDINIKDYYNYDTKIESKKDCTLLLVTCINFLFLFIPLLVYQIMFYINGKFNENNLKEGYAKRKKKYIDFMDNYISLLILGVSISNYIYFVLYYKIKSKILKTKQKIIYQLIVFCICFLHFLSYYYKYIFTNDIIQIDKDNNKQLWFEKFDRVIYFGSSIVSFEHFYLLFMYLFYRHFFKCRNFNDNISISLIQINGFHISDSFIPLEFLDLDKINKIKMIFKKENIEKFEYKLDDAQFNFINKINQLRRQNNILN